MVHYKNILLLDADCVVKNLIADNIVYPSNWKDKNPDTKFYNITLRLLDGRSMSFYLETDSSHHYISQKALSHQSQYHKFDITDILTNCAV
jgi:hypothetical protein